MSFVRLVMDIRIGMVNIVKIRSVEDSEMLIASIKNI